MDGDCSVLETLDSMVGNEHPTFDAALTLPHSDLGHDSEESSDNRDHIHYYHNLDTAPSQSDGVLVSYLW